MTPGLVAVLAVLACALAGGALWRRNYGRIRTIPTHVPRADGPASADRLTAEQLGQPLGRRATLVQFSSAFCAPCRATRRILTDVAGMTEGVKYVEVDAEARLDLVRRLNVLRTPTVLVTDGAGRIVKRASGQPRKPDVIAALGQAVDEASDEVADDAGEVDIPIYLIGNEDSDSGARHA